MEGGKLFCGSEFLYGRIFSILITKTLIGSEFSKKPGSGSIALIARLKMFFSFFCFHVLFSSKVYCEVLCELGTSMWWVTTTCPPGRFPPSPSTWTPWASLSRTPSTPTSGPSPPGSSTIVFLADILTFLLICSLKCKIFEVVLSV